MTASLLLSSALIFISVINTVLCLVPVVKHRSTEGIALTSTLTCMIGTATWAIYGLMQGNSAQAFVNVVATAGGLVILFVGYRSGRLSAAKSIALTAAYGSAVVALGAWGGIAAVGAVVAALSIANKVPQLLETWQRPGGPAVSVPANLLSFAVCSGWFLYGAVRLDVWLAISSAWCAGQAAFVAARTAQARRTAMKPAEQTTVAALAAAA